MTLDASAESRAKPGQLAYLRRTPQCRWLAIAKGRITITRTRTATTLGGERPAVYHPKTQEKIKGTTIVASDSIINFGVSSESLPQVIFSFGTAPE
jgi:hypothetical protein